MGSSPAGIAVLSMACRFPDASSPEAFWSNLAAGRDSVREVPKSRWDASALFDATGSSPGSSMSRWGAFLDGIEDFDAAFFRIREEEARVMDPQQRLLLDVGYEALERAGYGSARRKAVRIGVFVTAGDSGFNETLLPLVAARMPLPAMTAVGNLRNLVAARLSHAFGLRGPAMAVDTACSSSLVALHLARRSLEVGECDLALVGGVSVLLAATPYVLLSRARALSPTGRSRAFSVDADGFVPGEGAACLLLGRLDETRRRGDPVLGIVRATAVNNDGGSISPMAPNPMAQREVLADAYRSSGVDPATVSYVEAHGTGTRVGDRIETQSIAATFPAGVPGRRYVGSVKTNIGHLLQASAMPALLKVLLAFRHGALPPSLHCEQVDPSLGLEAAGLEVVRELLPWGGEGPLRAAIDSFGFGGTNAHVVLEAPPPRRAVARPSRVLLALSAMDEERLADSAMALAEHALDPALDGVLAYSASSARAPMPHRVAGVLDGGASGMSLADVLEALAQGELPRHFSRGHVPKRKHARVAFLLSGQGAQYPGQGAGLWASEPRFAERFEALSASLGDIAGRPLTSWCFDERVTPQELARTEVAQPLLVAFEVAVARFAESVGVCAEAFVGHSVGELAAWALAGALDDEAAVRLAADRGELMASLPPRGSMTVAFAPEVAVLEALAPWTDQASLAASNGPAQLVVSGADEALADIADRLDADGYRTAPLMVSHAFHSPLVTPVLAGLRQLGDDVPWRTPSRALMSTVTAEWSKSAPDGAYLARHAREPVRFDAAIAALLAEGLDTFVEVGPGATLAGLVRARPAAPSGERPLALAWLRRRDEDAVAWRRAAARLWVQGVDVDLVGLDLEAGGDVDAPERLPVPAHARRPVRLWPAEVPERGAALDAPHRFLVGRSAATLDRASFRVHVPGQDAIVAEHEVLDRTLVPGAGILELAFAAALRGLDEPPLGLVDVSFAAPLAGGLAAELTLRRGGHEVLFELEQEGRRVASGAVARQSVARLSVPPVGEGARPWSADALYRELEARGMKHGRSFRRIVELRVDDGLALAQLESRPPPTDLAFDPIVLDAALQVAAALLLRRRGAVDDGLLIPFHVERLVVHGGQGVVSRAQLRSVEGEPVETALLDVVLEDAAGAPVLEVHGLCLRRVAMARRAPTGTETIVHRVAYGAAPPGRSSLADQRIVGAPAGLLEALVAELAARGAKGRAVEAADLEVETGDEILLFASAGAPTMLAAARGLARAPGPSPTLRVVTVDHLAVRPQDRPEAAPAVALGLAQALRDEGSVPVGFVDVSGVEPSALARALVDECAAPLLEEPVAWRDGARFRRELVPDHGDEELSVAGGTFVVTGGASGVGLALARGLVARGAKALALVGRSALAQDPERRAAVEALRQDAKVFYRSVDVLEPQALDVLVADTLARFGAIDGVFHAAGIAEPGRVRELAEHELERVVAPKREGAENLLRALAAHEARPAFVALVSSISAALPGLASGLGSYAAGNAHLDALAEAAHARGLPVRSLAYGAWAGTGLGAHPALEASLAAKGYPALDPQAAVAATFRALRAEGPRHVIARFDARPPAVAPQAVELDHEVGVADEPVAAMLQRLVAEALEVPPAHVPTDAAFLSLGLESLAAVDLVKRLEALGVGRLPTTLFFEYQSIDELAVYLDGLLADEVPTSGPREVPTASPTPLSPTQLSPTQLSPTQLAFHTQHRLYPDIPAFAFLRQRVEGPLELESFVAALRQLEQRHPMLRTHFVLANFGDRPAERRVVEPRNEGWPPWLTVLDPAAERAAAEVAAMNRVFSLAEGPLFHVTLARESAEEHLVWLTFHHAIGDAWSLQCFASDLWRSYANVVGHGSSLAPLDESLVDAAIADERVTRSGDAHERAMAHFRALAPQLAVASRATLPYDGDVSAPPTGAFRVVHLDADRALSDAVPARARALGTTPFVVLLAAAFRALGKWSAQSALAIQVAVAGRDARVEGIEGVVGSFADALPVVVEVAPDVPFEERVRLVDGALRATLRHGSVRSVDLAPLLPRAGGRASVASPLSFSFARFPGAAVPDSPVVPTDLRGATATPSTRLGLAAYEWEGGLRFAWTYPSALFEDATVEGLAREFEATLRDALREEERVASDDSAPASMLDGFFTWAERHGETCALVRDSGVRTSYDELKRRAWGVEALLETLPAGPVGIVASRGGDFAAAALGALLAGRCFVPLDPDHPTARTGACATRAGVEHLLYDESGEEHARSLLEEHGGQLHAIAPLEARSGSKGRTRRADEVAYLMFTSGSTGEPKGVPILRAALERYVVWAGATLGFGPGVRSAWTASPAFDATCRQLFAPLSCGGAVRVVGTDTLRDPARLACVAGEVEIFAGVPTLLTSWLSAVEAHGASLEGLRYVHSGGEELWPQLLRRLRAALPSQARVINLYGPTETTINATYHVDTGQPLSGAVPIGRAVAEAQLAVGGPEGGARRGELWVGGPGLSPGYLADAEATARAFEVDRHGQRWYRTGDEVEVRGDGALVFLRRLDEQVQVRGHRVEPAEVATALRSMAGVHAAEVFAAADGVSLGARVVAEAHVDHASLRRELRRRLPAFMVPKDIALRAPAGASLEASVAPTEAKAPRTSTEEAVGEAFSFVLARPVGGEADFFDHGGDSLSLLRVFDRLLERFESLPRPAVAYEDATIVGLAAAIDAHLATARSPLASTDAADSLPIGPTQAGFLLTEALAPEQQSLWRARFWLHGDLDLDLLEVAVDAAVERHPMLRVSFPDGARSRRMVQLDESHRVVVARSGIGGDGEPLDAAWRRTREAPLPLDQWPQLRLGVHRVSSARHALFVVAHHVIGDGYSGQLLLRELVRDYDALVEGRALGEAPRSTYGEYVRGQQEQGLSEASVAHWRGVFGRPYEAPRLRPPEHRRASAARSCTRRVAAAELKGVSARGLPGLVLAAYHRALEGLTGQRDLVIGVATAGRFAPTLDLPRVFGPFALALPIRLGEASSPVAAAATAALDAAQRHAADAASIVRACDGATSLRTASGAQFFFTHLDFEGLGPIESTYLDLEPDADATAMTPTSIATDVLCASTPEDGGLRLLVHGVASALDRAALERFADRLASAVVELAEPPQREEGRVVEAALVGYLPSVARVAALTGLAAADIVEPLRARYFPGGEPRHVETSDTPLGRSAYIALPLFADELVPANAERVLALVTAALATSRELGARSVSLAGVLPTLLQYGVALEAPPGLEVTTGHAATVVAVLASLDAVMSRLDLPRDRLRLAVVGVGSIGRASIERWLRSGDAPDRLVLCDRSAAQPAVERFRDELLRTGLCRDVSVVVGSAAGLPQEVYDAGLILGAATAPGLLDVDRVRPGTVIVDDSFPHLFDADAARARMQRDGDALFVGAGLAGCDDVRHRFLLDDVPAEVRRLLAEARVPNTLPGCQLEALLRLVDPRLAPVRGLVDADVVASYQRAARDAGVRAAPLHLEGYRPSAALLERVAELALARLAGLDCS